MNLFKLTKGKHLYMMMGESINKQYLYFRTNQIALKIYFHKVISVMIEITYVRN